VLRCIKCVIHFLTVRNCAEICKVGDFGLARWQPDGDMGVDTRVIGTFGYVLYRSLFCFFVKLVCQICDYNQECIDTSILADFILSIFTHFKFSYIEFFLLIRDLCFFINVILVLCISIITMICSI
jgi:hypothetical protein